MTYKYRISVIIFIVEAPHWKLVVSLKNVKYAMVLCQNGYDHICIQKIFGVVMVKLKNKMAKLTTKHIYLLDIKVEKCHIIM